MTVRYDKKTGRYRNAKGEFVSERMVRKAIDKTIKGVEEKMRTISRKLTENAITLPEWQTRMADLIKYASTLTGAIGAGGRAQMTAQKWGKVGAGIREQYKYLNNFARQIEQRRLSSKQIEHRGSSYAKAARRQFFTAQKDAKAEAGFSRVKRVLHAMESCAGCLSWAGQGFVPIDEMPDLGSLECKNWCLCEFEYSRAK